MTVTDIPGHALRLCPAAPMRVRAWITRAFAANGTHGLAAEDDLDLARLVATEFVTAAWRSGVGELELAGARTVEGIRMEFRTLAEGGSSVGPPWLLTRGGQQLVEAASLSWGVDPTRRCAWAVVDAATVDDRPRVAAGAASP